jgi:hypothetical protein
MGMAAMMTFRGLFTVAKARKWGLRTDLNPMDPYDIISYAVWLYYRFNLSNRDIEDLLAKRGVTVSREAIRLWCIKFGVYGDTFFIDEVFVKIKGEQHYRDLRTGAFPEWSKAVGWDWELDFSESETLIFQTLKAASI